MEKEKELDWEAKASKKHEDKRREQQRAAAAEEADGESKGSTDPGKDRPRSIRTQGRSPEQGEERKESRLREIQQTKAS